MDYRAGGTVRFGGRGREGRLPDRPNGIGPIGAGKAFEAKANVLAPLFVADLDEKFGLAKADFRRLNPARCKRREEQATVFLANGRKVYGNLAVEKVPESCGFSVECSIPMLPAGNFAVVRLDGLFAAIEHAGRGLSVFR